eukprot:321943-Chlamydomonas_euryale.AAC.3
MGGAACEVGGLAAAEVASVRVWVYAWLIACSCMHVWMVACMADYVAGCMAAWLHALAACPGCMHG